MTKTRGQHATQHHRVKKGFSPKGFTLIELLVVIAIIAILASILMPAIQHVREKGERTKIIAHVKQVGLAMESYRLDYNSLPMAGGAGGSGGEGSANLALLLITQNLGTNLIEHSFSDKTPTLTDGGTEGRWDDVDTDTLTDSTFGWNTTLTASNRSTTPVIADDPDYYEGEGAIIGMSDTSVKYTKAGEANYESAFGTEEAITDDTLIKY